MDIIIPANPPDCQKCKLYKSRTNIVSSYIPIDTEVLFLAEAPGNEEDLKGTQPLIGPAGIFFNDCLSKAGFSRNDPRFGFANVVRCRPVKYVIDKEGNQINKNRPPTDIEIRACSSFLDQEISKLKNLKLIVSLGAIGLKRLLNNAKLHIEQVRGTLFNNTPYGPVLATYHPARALHSYDEREKAKITAAFVEDLKKINTILNYSRKSIHSYSHFIVKKLSQAEWLFSQLNLQSIFSFDIETSNFDYLNSKILCISFSWR